ncbi:MAG TPA: PEP-CTERM sorting domain-containing protein [Halomicronema sp.]
MSNLKRKLVLLMFALSAIEVGFVLGNSPAVAENTSSYNGWALDCSSGTCTRSYVGANLATTSQKKSIPEPNLMLGILAVGGVMFLCRKKRNFSPIGNKKLS